jgi:hypothetical protein
MKIAVLSESPADEAAIHVLIAGLLGRQTQPIEPSRQLRTRGWPAVLQVIPAELKRLHYYLTDTYAFAVVVDADNSPLHQSAHEAPGGEVAKCRLCQLRQVVAKTQNQLSPVPGRAPLQIAIGTAVPSIEAWYRCGLEPHINEITCLQNPQIGLDFHTRNQLKRYVYGTERPSLTLATQRAIEAAQCLVQSLSVLESLFPNGFGALARDVRCWTLG